MAVTISRLGYKRLSRIIFEWQAADRAAMLALFMVMDVSLHWLWFLFVWLRRGVYEAYVDMALFYPLWLGVSIAGLFFWWMMSRLTRSKVQDAYLYKWQIVMITIYSIYIAIVVVVMGHSSLVSGVSLVGGAMLGMMLARRRYMWKAFLFHIIVILAATLLPYLGFYLPDLRKMTLAAIPIDTYSYLTYSEMTTVENALVAPIFHDGAIDWNNLHQLRLSSSFFWRSTHMYLALPKAIFIVYMFRTLLLIIDKSKAEILNHANQDELTQLKNRRYGLSRMQQVIVAVKDKQDFSVILLDLDWFKDVNDNYGHEAGDQVLREVAQTLKSALPASAIISRYGGEEFLIVLPNTNHDQALIMAEHIRQSIAKQEIKVDEEVNLGVSASLGLYTLTFNELNRLKEDYLAVAQSNTSPTTPRRFRIRHTKSKIKKVAQLEDVARTICQHTITTADKALYKAKDQGRNRTVSANEIFSKEHMIV